MSEQSTIEKPKGKFGGPWTPEQRAKRAATFARKRAEKAGAASPPANPPKPPATVGGKNERIEHEAREAFQRLYMLVTKNETENTVGKDAAGEPIKRMYQMDSFRVEKVDGFTKASWRCGWNDVDDPSSIAKPILTDYEWSKRPDDIEIKRGFDATRPRSEITFELYWEN